jgi:hypothetical protein
MTSTIITMAPLGPPTTSLATLHNMDVAMSFLGNVAMNKIMGASTINQNDDLPMLDVTD